VLYFLDGLIRLYPTSSRIETTIDCLRCSYDID